MFVPMELFEERATQPIQDRVASSVPVFRSLLQKADRLSIVSRMLGIVTEVRPAEVTTGLLLSLDSFLLLSAYACIKPVREAFILALPSGAEYKIYMAGATAVTLLLAVPLYAKAAARLPRNRLLVWVTLFFASHLAMFYAAGAKFGTSRILGLGFYIWIGVFNMMMVAQFWAFSNDIYSEEAGRRLFPLLGLGASVGAVAGSALAKELIRPLGPLALLLVSAAILLVSAAVVQVVHLRETRHGEGAAVRSRDLSPIGGSGSDAFKLVLHNRYLTTICSACPDAKMRCTFVQFSKPPGHYDNTSSLRV